MAIVEVFQADTSTATFNVNRKTIGDFSKDPVVLENAWGDTMHAEALTLVVPENRTSESSNQITIGRLNSISPDPLPPVVVLAGGPGGSGISLAKSEYSYLFKELRAVADVILIDQRGTGRSISPTDHFRLTGVVCRRHLTSISSTAMLIG